MEESADVQDRVSVELTPGEARLIGQMRGEIPPDRHQHQGLIDAREAEVRAAGEAYDDVLEELSAAREEAAADAKAEYDLRVAEAQSRYGEAVAAKAASEAEGNA